jgi:hypothetical protein
LVLPASSSYTDVTADTLADFINTAFLNFLWQKRVGIDGRAAPIMSITPSFNQ